MKNILKLLMLVILGVSFSANTLQNNPLGLQQDRKSYTTKKVPEKVEFSYSCVINNPFAQAAFMAHQADVNAMKMMPVEITAKEENEFGDRMYNEMKNEYKFITSGAKLNELNKMMNTLLRCRNSQKTQLGYTMHLIDDELVNAFTAGGHIYVTTGIIDYCNTTSELASIIAHEIGHNEKGHITNMLKTIKAAGQFGNIVQTIKQLMTMPFNQFNEVEVDCYGADLCNAAGYKSCKGAELWKRMAADNREEPTLYGKFFRTHPYSIERYDCMKKHIKTNYGINCN